MRIPGAILTALSCLACGCGSNHGPNGSAGSGASGTSSGAAPSSSSGTSSGSASSSASGTSSGSGAASSSSLGASSAVGGASGTSSGSGSAPSSSSGTSSGVSGTSGACLASTLAQSLGRDHTLVGFSGQAATASAAPFDLQYIYLSGGLFDSATPCTSCLACTSNGTSCVNGNGAPGCAWWGCWQYDMDPPGETARNLISSSAALANPQIAMFTYYEILQASGASQGADEVAAVNGAPFLTRYLNDFRFLLNQIGDATAFVHVEPDFWGFAEQVNTNPHLVPAAVPTANPTDCGTLEASVAGLGQCMIAMARTYAPNAKIGLHASAWASGVNILTNSDATLDLSAEATKVASFLAACGANTADFVVSDISDRDAAYYTSIGQDTWWDATNATLPNFHQAWTYGQALATDLGVPVVWWQIPVGNLTLPNDCTQWQDNRVDYILTHLDEIAAGDGIAVAFGAGTTCMTTPESDNGNLIAQTQALTPEPVCGP